jgi:mono/diheme cytochrome c family protein
MNLRGPGFVLICVFSAALIVACGRERDPNAAAPLAAIGGSNEHGLALLRNPYAGQADAIAAGRELFVTRTCSGCHGAAGGGGMCPPLINDAWVYGSDDTTLFNLIRGGSVGLAARGYVRGTREKVAGDMPPLGAAISEDETWKLLAYIRSRYASDPALRKN